MKIIFVLISIIASGPMGCAARGNAVALSDAAVITASMDDFRILEGKAWGGSLSYLNYGSNDRAKIPVKVAITIFDDQTLQYAVRYPGEEQYNAIEKLVISRDGTRINGNTLTARVLESDDTLVLTTQAVGRDDNRPADIQMVYFISENAFRMRKNVRFDQSEKFFNRNEYSFSR